MLQAPAGNEGGQQIGLPWKWHCLRSSPVAPSVLQVPAGSLPCVMTGMGYVSIACHAAAGHWCWHLLCVITSPVVQAEPGPPVTRLQVPAGSLPRTMEVVLRHEVVETARAGDKMAFVGNLIVVPDVAAISAPGERVEARAGDVCKAN